MLAAMRQSVRQLRRGVVSCRPCAGETRYEPIDTPDQTFEKLLRPHLQRLHSLAWRLAGQKAEAEDLFQELLIKAYGKLEQLLTIDEPGAWLARMMYNLFIDERRRFARRRLTLVEEGELAGDGIADFAGDDNPEANQERHERLRRVDTALSQLTDEHRIVVLLHDAEGYKIKEIQELTGLAEGTVKSRLHRARARLQEILCSGGTFS